MRSLTVWTLSGTINGYLFAGGAALARSFTFTIECIPGRIIEEVMKTGVIAGLASHSALCPARETMI